MSIAGCAAIAAVLLASSAAAQMTCRSNALGAEACVGVPAPEARTRAAIPPAARGLAGVQPRVRPQAGSELTPAGRTDALGNTFLTEGDLPPARQPRGLAPRDCRRDALGNLICR